MAGAMESVLRSAIAAGAGDIPAADRVAMLAGEWQCVAVAVAPSARIFREGLALAYLVRLKGQMEFTVSLLDSNGSWTRVHSLPLD